MAYQVVHEIKKLGTDEVVAAIVLYTRHPETGKEMSKAQADELSREIRNGAYYSTFTRTKKTK